MTLPSLATVADMEIRLGVPVGSLAGLDLARAQAALDDTSALVRDEGLDWVADDGVTITAPKTVVVVTVKAALRAYRNPDEFQSENVGGEYAYQYAPGSTSAYLTAEEIAIVTRAARVATGGTGGWSGTGSIRTPSGYAETSTASAEWEWPA